MSRGAIAVFRGPSLTYSDFVQGERIEGGQIDLPISGGADAHDDIARNENAALRLVDAVMPGQRLAVRTDKCGVIGIADGERPMIAGRGVAGAIADQMQRRVTPLIGGRHARPDGSVRPDAER